MINAEITFYNVGLSDKNLPYNRTALVNILAAGVITNGGQTYKLRLTDLAFGTPFNIDEATYQIVASATYIEIYTKDENNHNDQYRYCFINNFLRLANGNWAVSYTIDDWTSFYIGGQSGTSPYNIHIDGFTERANVPLCKYENTRFRITARRVPLSGKRETNGFKRLYQVKLNRFGSYTQGLPNGYICAVYFINDAKYKGDPSGTTAHGTLIDWNIDNPTDGDYYHNPRILRRDNSNIFFMVFKPSSNQFIGNWDHYYNIEIEDSDGNTVCEAGQYTPAQVDDSTIDKIMYFDFIPSPDGSFDSENNVIKISGNSDNFYKAQTADIIYIQNDVFNRGYYQAVKISAFCPCMHATIQSAQAYDYYDANDNQVKKDYIKFNGYPFNKSNNYADYIKNSLYQFIDESRKIKIRYLTAEIEIPMQLFFGGNSGGAISFSGDGETVVLRYCNTVSNISATDIYSDPVLRCQMSMPEFSATGQNINYFDLVHVRDFKSYKNAKITGAAGIAATALGSITALGTSIATGNVAGVVGSLAGGSQGVIGGIQKLQSLSPMQQSPANGDYTLTQMVNHSDIPLTIEIEESMPVNKLSDLRILEENGALVSMPFDDYISGCQMEAFNALKMANVDVSGAPQQIARRIEEALLSGITLWTATDVGNKKVINYPLETGA